jgi:hypothetical protein
VLVVLPFLFFPKLKLEKATQITAPTPTFFRLYGVALFALIVGYSFGIQSAENNIFPLGVVFMGLVSNGGATSILLLSRKTRQNLTLGFFFAFVTIALTVAIVFPEAALQKTWYCIA